VVLAPIRRLTDGGRLTKLDFTKADASLSARKVAQVSE
jgi:hypothetical protein